MSGSIRLVPCKRLFVSLFAVADGGGRSDYREWDVLIASLNPDIETPNLDRILSMRIPGNARELSPMSIKLGFCMAEERMEAEDQILNILASLGLLVDDEDDEEE